MSHSDSGEFKLSCRKTVAISTRELVRTGYISEGQTLPLLILPSSCDVSLSGWAEDNHEFIQAELLRHGAILFRGFSVRSHDGFRLLVSKIAREPMAYTERSSPRSEVGENIYT